MHYTLDTVGSIVSLLSTVLYIRVSNYAWPTTLLAILLNITLYVLTGLYADAGKEAIFFMLGIYGWHWWLKGKKTQNPQPIRRLKKQHWIYIGLLNAFGTLVIAQLLQHYTHSQVPYWDAITAALSLTAQWLICRKILECWIFWFIVDTLYIGLYFYKGLPAHTVLLIVYTGMALVGYIVWRKRYQTQSRTFKYRSYKRDSSLPEAG